MPLLVILDKLDGGAIFRLGHRAQQLRLLVAALLPLHCILLNCSLHVFQVWLLLTVHLLDWISRHSVDESLVAILQGQFLLLGLANEIDELLPHTSGLLRCLHPC